MRDATPTPKPLPDSPASPRGEASRQTPWWQQIVNGLIGAVVALLIAFVAVGGRISGIEARLAALEARRGSLPPGPALPTSPPSSPATCSMTITSPQPGTEAPQQVTVEGTATLPEDAFLWLLVRRADAPGWWPQCGSALTISGTAWRCVARLGEPRDEGHRFEITVAAVAAPENADLEGYVADSAGRNDWTPRPVPRLHRGCSLARPVQVTRR